MKKILVRRTLRAVGLTGGIGSGKSTVSKIFETLGVKIFHADEEAKKILAENAEVIDAVKKLFGNDIYDKNNNPDRRKIAEIIFRDKKKLEKLNSIIHPKVFEAFAQWIAGIPSNHPYVIKEAALLYESGSYKTLDKMIAVYSPLPLRMKRVMERDKCSEKEFLARAENQMPDEEKIKRADFIIYNDESHPLIPQVMEIHKMLCDV